MVEDRDLRGNFFFGSYRGRKIDLYKLTPDYDMDYEVEVDTEEENVCPLED